MPDFSNWRNFILPTFRAEREVYYESSATPTSYTVSVSVTWLYRRITVEWHGRKK